MTFHAGTSLEDGNLMTSGGRVLCVVGLGDSVKMAQKQAYAVRRPNPLRRRADPARHRLARDQAAGVTDAGNHKA